MTPVTPSKTISLSKNDAALITAFVKNISSTTVDWTAVATAAGLSTAKYARDRWAIVKAKLMNSDVSTLSEADAKLFVAIIRGLKVVDWATVAKDAGLSTPKYARDRWAIVIKKLTGEKPTPRSKLTGGKSTPRSKHTKSSPKRVFAGPDDVNDTPMGTPTPKEKPNQDKKRKAESVLDDSMDVDRPESIFSNVKQEEEPIPVNYDGADVNVFRTPTKSASASRKGKGKATSTISSPTKVKSGPSVREQATNRLPNEILGEDVFFGFDDHEGIEHTY